MTDSYQVIFEHVARTLPDSLTERKRLLEALGIVLKPSHPAHASVAAQLSAIRLLEVSQAELPLKFQPKAFGKPHHNGEAK